MSDTEFLISDLIDLRKELGLTQQEMAGRLDMAIRAYQAIESGESSYRYIHRLAVERVALAISVDKKQPMLAPKPIRDDAIELVRIGRALKRPEFLNEDPSLPDQQADRADTNSFRAAYAVVGELVLLATALDHQLNHVLIQVLPLIDSPMLEAVVASLDSNRKIEILKARAKFINSAPWRKALETQLDKIEKVNAWRNLVSHTVLIPDAVHGAVFAPTAASKLLKNLQVEPPSLRKVPIAEARAAIKIGEGALFEGQQLIMNFARMNTELQNRKRS